MTREQIIKEYNRLVSEIEPTQMYDGRGEYNGYTCKKCGYVTVTLYKDKGVTPFIIKCSKCGGAAMHNITSRVAPPCVPDTYSEVKNWVRPTIEQFLEELKLYKDIKETVDEIYKMLVKKGGEK